MYDQTRGLSGECHSDIPVCGMEIPMLDHSLNDAHDALAIIGDAEWFEYSKAANPIRPSLSPEVPA